MKKPSSFLTNTTTPAGRANGQAIDDPGGGLGTGVDNETFNDPAYAVIAPIESYKDGGISDSDETTLASDMRDTLEEITDRRVTDSGTPANSIAEWDSGTTYSAVELVTWKGFQFVAYDITGNLNKNPLLFPDFWMIIPKPDDLLDKFFSGQAVSGGLSTIADRAHANFAQNIEYGHYRLGGNGDDFYEFFRVALDGTVVTGDATLNDDIFKEGTGNEYWNLDIIAPDVLGTRTLLDMGERYIRQQSAGGLVDTLGEVHDDAGQTITGNFPGGRSGSADGVFTITGTRLTITDGASSENDIGFNSADSTSPNTAKTDDDETRVKALVEGISYIIVMNVL